MVAGFHWARWQSVISIPFLPKMHTRRLRFLSIYSLYHPRNTEIFHGLKSSMLTHSVRVSSARALGRLCCVRLGSFCTLHSLFHVPNSLIYGNSHPVTYCLLSNCIHHHGQRSFTMKEETLNIVFFNLSNSVSPNAALWWHFKRKLDMSSKVGISCVCLIEALIPSSITCTVTIKEINCEVLQLFVSLSIQVCEYVHGGQL